MLSQTKKNTNTEAKSNSGIIGIRDKLLINERKVKIIPDTQKKMIVKYPISIELKTQHKKNKSEEFLNKLWTPDGYVKLSTRLPFKTPELIKNEKRIYERRSANGKGKQISKNGAGSKTTWGNLEQLAKLETLEYLINEEEKSI